MRRAHVGRMATLAIAALAATTAPAATPTPFVVERIRYIGTLSYSRVVVDLSGPAEYRVLPVSADGKSAPPNRLVVDVAAAKVGPEAREPLEVSDSMLRRIRTGQYTLDTARIVLDLARDVEARTFLLPDPYRLVIDIKGKGGALPLDDTRVTRADTARAAAARPERSLEPSAAALPGGAEPAVADAREATHARRGDARPAARAEPPAAPHRFKVVIDPGHGGKDPGAHGMHGVDEKDVVLAVSKLLASSLRADGIEVVLTRTDDRFLSLEERTGLANAQGADLFVSIHANASTNPGLRGVEVYYLNNTDNRGTLRLAAMENNLHWDPRNPELQSAIPDLSYILSDLRQTYKVEESKQLAEQLQESVVSRLGADYDRVDDLGVKEGPFYVLVGAYMPCVLVEVSFLTNPVEGRRLGTPQYRHALAEGVYQGIRRYIAQTKLAKTL
jgi:N-acetylmuramoyl-L-alanine amidase